jgi:hypothetical protein
VTRFQPGDEVFGIGKGAFAEGEQRYDVTLDIGGNPSLSRLRRALAPKGTLVITGGETGGRWLGGYDRGKVTPVIDRTFPLT